MTDIQTPALVAGDEAIAATESVVVEPKQSGEQGQVEPQTAEGDKPEDDERKSRSKERRERQKAHNEQVRQEADTARREAQAAITRVQAMEAAAKTLPPPKQTDFGTYEDFQAALTAHHMLRATDAREIERLKEQSRASFEAVKAVEDKKQEAYVAAINLIVDEGKSLHPDFEKVALTPEVKITPDMVSVIAETDAPGEVAYYLGKNPALSKQIADMTPTQMARAIGKIEAQLSAPQAKTVSDAPDPIAPVRAKATATKSVADMSPAEYAAWREKGGTFKL